ncbi:MAG: hypothetical protein RML33_03370 [Acidobacteriota bacterium]|nr:hypothetical protein [Pyrinomonadaceae bacterium]MDW8303860.1 hypothetical protein [Acidobacteriota bacterium]
MKNLILSSFVAVVSFFTVFAQGEVVPRYTSGDVVSISSGAIVLQTKDGEIEVVISSGTVFKRVPPENPKLSAAVDSSISEVSVGDKILVTGNFSSDRKKIEAKSVYLMTKSDISRKQEKEREEWRRRGISGQVISLDIANKTIIISTRSMMGERTVTIIPKDNAEYRRYAPDSVKFSDAKISNYSELSVGDQLRALGDRSADGSTFAAEKIVFGSFKTAGGKITAIDLQRREIRIKDILTDKEVTIVISKDSMLKRFPSEFAAMFLSRSQETFQPPQQQQPPQQRNVGAGQSRGTDLDELVERFPDVKLEELKVGDAIAVSSTIGEIPNRLTAIKLLSGIEPFIEAQQAMQRRRGFNGQGSGFNIPGLDGISFP